MPVNAKLPSKLETLTKLELIKLVQDLSEQRPETKAPSMPNKSRVQVKRPASQADLDGALKKKKRVATPIQAGVRREPNASWLAGQARRTAQNARLEERSQKRQATLAEHSAAPPVAQIRTMASTGKLARYGRGDAISNLKVTVPVFGDTNDDGSLKKEISLVAGGMYTFPGQLLLKIWTSPTQPMPRKLLVTQKSSSHSSCLAKYLLRLKKTRLVAEDKDGFHLTNTFKPWMLTGVQPTSAKFKPSVRDLYFRDVHQQAGGLPSVK